jgi:hypothetical protein
MRKSDFIIAAVLVLVGVMAMKYFQQQEHEQQALDIPPEADVQEATVEPEEAEIRYPVPELPVQIEQPATEPEPESQPLPPQEEAPAEPVKEPAAPEPEKPLPTLDNSDDVLRQDLYTLAARQVLDSLFNLNHIIRRFVVTVDNLPRKHLLNRKHRSNQAVRGQPIIEQDSHGYYLSEKNFTRYDPFIDLLENLNTRQVLAFYLHYYPLIQAAYEDLGYPSAYFNDRFIDVIDHLLDAPDISGRVSLVRPHVLYKFADPEMEALSAGQKVLLRIGPRNAARVKSKLRELRQTLAGK